MFIYFFLVYKAVFPTKYPLIWFVCKPSNFIAKMDVCGKYLNHSIHFETVAEKELIRLSPTNDKLLLMEY